MNIIELTSENFEQEVMNSDKTVLIDFWADWCMPCKMLSPIIDQIAQERSDIKVCKVNVEQQGNLAAQFKIISVPTLFVIKSGKIVNQSSGVMPKNQILAML